MPTVIVTAGAANANSFEDVAGSDAYHATRLHATDWTTANPATKETALIMATREIVARWAWNGFAVTETQALPFPRAGLLTRNGFALPYTTVPQAIKDATSEYARQLIAEDRAADSDVEAQGITSIKAGPVSLTFKDHVEAKPVPDAVVALIPREWGYPVGRNVATRELVRS